MSFLIIISVILLIIGLAILWGECDPGEGGPCVIKWAILWFWKKKLLSLFLIVLIVGGVAGYYFYLMPSGTPLNIAREPRGGSNKQFFISRVQGHGKVSPHSMPNAYLNPEGELEIVMGNGRVTASEVLGPVVVYYTENSIPVRARVILDRHTAVPKIEYDNQLGILSIIFRENAKIDSVESNGRCVGYFDKNGRIVRVEIPNVNITE